jgi:hypothetical protein
VPDSGACGSINMPIEGLHGRVQPPAPPKGTRWGRELMNCVIRPRVAGSILNRVTEICHSLNPVFPLHFWLRKKRNTDFHTLAHVNMECPDGRTRK